MSDVLHFEQPNKYPFNSKKKKKEKTRETKIRYFCLV